MARSQYFDKVCMIPSPTQEQSVHKKGEETPVTSGDKKGFIMEGTQSRNSFAAWNRSAIQPGYPTVGVW